MELQTPLRYVDRDFQVETVKILPGQYHASAGGEAIATVLGSCVATCLWDPLRRIGGMNHFMLPGDTPTTSPWAVSARVGVYAMEVLINEMLHLGADRRRIVAKAFGGARVLQGFDTLEVGAKNAGFVVQFLREEGIELVAQDLLGASPRKVHFFPSTGKVQVKKLHLGADDLQLQEREYMSRLRRAPRGGDVDIFRTPR